MTDTPPETEYGRRLRALGYDAEADLIDRLILRERVCDSQCGAMQAAADAWYRAEKEFDLSDDDPYEAIKRLREMLDHLGKLSEDDHNHLVAQCGQLTAGFMRFIQTDNKCAVTGCICHDKCGCREELLSSLTVARA